jgi:hypothetical protein
MEIGAAAHRLLQQAKSDAGAPVGTTLPPFETDQLSSLAREATWLFNRNKRIMESSQRTPEVMTGLYVQHAAAHRNKRAGLIYVNNRMKRIAGLVLDSGLVGSEDMKRNMTDLEGRFADDYRKLVIDYGRTTGVALGESLVPPKLLLLNVEILKDLGRVETSRGPVTMRAGARMCLRRPDIEPLVRNGSVRVVSAYV